VRDERSVRTVPGIVDAAMTNLVDVTHLSTARLMARIVPLQI
jgi:hypothetical protein